MIRPAAGVRFPSEVAVLVIGAGACGLVAALAANEAGAEVLVVERDALPSGSTALSSGLVPAAATRFQAERGVADSVDAFIADIMAKNKHGADPTIVRLVATGAGPAIEWLADRHGVGFELVEGFLYPGHGVARMHGTSRRTGQQLMGSLTAAVTARGIDMLTSAQVTALYAEPDGRIAGVAITRPDGSGETIGCRALVLACNGYGGNRELVARHVPEMAGALYFGHAGNTGDALLWGEALGGVGRDLGGYQGHGAVAQPHGVLITWALMMEGGIQVNAAGARFSNEHLGYSEQAAAVLAQPDGVAFCLYDERLHRLGRQFEDYRVAERTDAIRRAEAIEDLAGGFAIAPAALARTLAETRALAAGRGSDPFGRDFRGKPALAAPFYGVRVTGALFHTQGGLAVDDFARVLRHGGAAMPNLFAGGGAARGVSGATAAGYLSGNGLLTAVVLGRVAGANAAGLVLSGR
jgi:fumarate reductase flavoprotein subunit